MALIDFILNLAALLIWLSWRSRHFDPLTHTPPATLVGTLRRAEPTRWRNWQLISGLVLLLVLRGWFYWSIGSSAEWTPKLDLGIVVLAFRSDRWWTTSLFSCLSFTRVAVIFYFWLLVLTAINRETADSDPIQKLIRLHLGRLGRWPWPIQLLIPIFSATLAWLVLYPLLAQLEVLNPVRAWNHLFQQGLLVGGALIFTLKFLLPPFLVLHLFASYVYLGKSPVWDFVSNTARNLLAPLHGLPLRLSRLDLAPIVGLVLVFLVLHWLPGWFLTALDRRNLTLWPQ